MPRTNERERNLNKIKDAIDRIVSKARENDIEDVSIHVDLIISITGIPLSTIYSYGTYRYLRTTYESVEYVENKGTLIVECEQWVEERKEEREERAEA